MDKKPGRPRKYESAAEKVDAFRQRLQSAGYLRKEVLVTQSTWEQVQALAQAQGVGVVDVASGLLEHGLRHYEGRALLQDGPPQAVQSLQNGPVAFASLAIAPQGALLGGSLRAARQSVTAPETQLLGSAPAVSGNSASPDNPILNFFARRKEQL